MPIVGVLTVYLGAYLLLLFASVCLATGLYYLAEAVEESPRLARWVLQRGVAAVRRQPPAAALARPVR